jgi:hypothetical protein
MTINGRLRQLLTHRVIRALTDGKWPDHDVDHEDRNRAFNQIGNLREATNAQNHQNMSLSSANTSGVKGVHWDKNRGKWAVEITVNYRALNLGRFDTFEEACDVRWAAEMIYHPFRARPKPVDLMKIIPDGAFVTGCWSIEGKSRQIRKLEKPTWTTTSTTVLTYA